MLANGETSPLGDEVGVHRGNLSAGGDYLIDTYSSIEQPWEVVLRKANGEQLRKISGGDRSNVADIALAKIRFLQIKADDGTPLNAMLLTPADLDESEKHPVIVHTYGGPEVQLVLNMWTAGPRGGLFDHWLVEQGFLVFALDNRGSAGRGRSFAGVIDHDLGQHELADQLASVRWLKSQSYVDGDRIGLWGWSYGGNLTAYALTHAPGVFAAGVAVAPVTDWHLYDSIYTERYMGTPDENPKGYDKSSVLAAISELSDPLLVIHGTGDDNVHFQNTEQLAQAAWKAGTTFDLMLFPNLKHGIYAPGSQLQVFRRIGGFSLEQLEGRPLNE